MKSSALRMPNVRLLGKMGDTYGICSELKAPGAEASTQEGRIHDYFLDDYSLDRCTRDPLCFLSPRPG